MTELNALKGIVVGQFGQAITLTVCDNDGIAVDISSYTTAKKVALRDPFGLNAKVYDATFVTDGTNGQIQFTPASGDIDRPGTWHGQIELRTASASAVSLIFDVEVEEKISPST